MMQQTLTDERLMTRAEVQTHFGLTQRFLEVSAVRGDGPPMVKIGRSVRYRVADLRDWIAARRVNSTSEEVRQ
ncbi:helix-turn-helix transcriptional regulator [Phaeovulum sp.]|uniref:helix-turn-helix transcriptional regulator n=1 Tax=Phaeovulum sp. TaxID=2934796 RepID=UPI003564C3B2